MGSELEKRLQAWNAQAGERIEALRERAEARAFAREFVDGLAGIARDVWREVGREALKAAAMSLVSEAVDKLEER